MSAILHHRFHVLKVGNNSVAPFAFILAEKAVKTHTHSDGVSVERNEVTLYSRVSVDVADRLVFALALHDAGLEMPADSVTLLHEWREWSNDPAREVWEIWTPRQPIPQAPAPGSAGPVEIAVPGVATVSNP